MKIHLQPKQRKLYDWLESTGPDVATVLGAGGAKGGGKSAGARKIALLLLTTLGPKYPGVTVTIVRRVSDDLKKNHIDELFLEYPELHKYYHVTDKELIFPKGGRLAFAYAETEEDVKRKFVGGYQSAFIFVDEAQQFSEKELQWITMAARWTKSDRGLPKNFCKTALFFNPGGQGSPYNRRVFWTKQYQENEEASTFNFIHVFGWDNYEWFRGQVDIEEEEFYSSKYPSVCEKGFAWDVKALGRACRCCRFHIFITQTSEGIKYNKYPAAMKKGYLFGSFDDFEGQYFAGAWDEQKCTIPVAVAETLRQPWWTHWMSMDWGWGGPPRPHYSVNLWWAIGKLSPQTLSERLGILSNYALDAVIVYRSRHACLMPEEEWAQRVVDATPLKERSVIGRHFVDGAVFSTDRRSDNTIADLMKPAFEQGGFPQMEPADKDRIGGWRQLSNAFIRTCNARTNPVMHPLDGPLLLISADCADLIRGIPLLIHDEDRQEDVLKTEAIEDDYADTLRYGYKSMLEAQWQPPRDIRAKQVYDSIQGDDADTMTARAMAMLKFNQDNPVRRSGAPPRWRPRE